MEAVAERPGGGRANALLSLPFAFFCSVFPDFLTPPLGPPPHPLPKRSGSGNGLAFFLRVNTGAGTGSGAGEAFPLPPFLVGDEGANRTRSDPGGGGLPNGAALETAFAALKASFTAEEPLALRRL
jgi:hypothetical protein